MFVPSTTRLRNVTVTMEEDVARWARMEAARRDTSVSRLLGALLKERMSAQNDSAAEAAERLASFGKRHRSLGERNCTSEDQLGLLSKLLIHLENPMDLGDKP
jgi:hypothetical protein